MAAPIHRSRGRWACCPHLPRHARGAAVLTARSAEVFAVANSQTDQYLKSQENNQHRRGETIPAPVVAGVCDSVPRCDERHIQK